MRFYRLFYFSFLAMLMFVMGGCYVDVEIETVIPKECVMEDYGNMQGFWELTHMRGNAVEGPWTNVCFDLTDVNASAALSNSVAAIKSVDTAGNGVKDLVLFRIGTNVCASMGESIYVIQHNNVSASVRSITMASVIDWMRKDNLSGVVTNTPDGPYVKVKAPFEKFKHFMTTRVELDQEPVLRFRKVVSTSSTNAPPANCPSPTLFGARK